jgi:hypothetical protein
MIILGVILLIAGFLLGFYLLVVLGLILALAGVGLMLAGRRGHSYGGRSHWW